MKNFLFIGLSALLCFSTSFVSALPINSTSVGLVRRTQKKTDSGLTVSNVPSDWPDDATLTRVLASAPGKAFFWTGRNGGVSVEDKALLVAKAQGGNTLEGTLSSGGVIMPDFDFGYVTGRSTREGNIFHKDELPRLKRNRRINKIFKIDSTTARRTLVFDRNAGKLDAAANEANLRRAPTLSVVTLSPVKKRAAPAARNQRRKAAAAPACPLPGAAQNKKVVHRSVTASKVPKRRTFPAGGKKPAAKPPAQKRKVARPANRPKRTKGKAAPARKRTTSVKKPKKAAKPATKAPRKAEKEKIN
ncbi:hypothetical protein DFH09DRAFT_1224580, partial [Mycena vulgaris]